MATLQEILAAKRLASQNQTSTAKPSVQEPIPAIPSIAPAAEKEEKEISPLMDAEPTPAAPEIKAEEKNPVIQKTEETKPAVPPAKKSFAELMAEKKAASTAPSIAVKEIPKPTAAPVPIPVKETQPIETATDAEKVYYQEIKPKIDLLSSCPDADLGNAMSVLKAALMSNPAATELMLDTDIGELVKALRRRTGEAITAAPLKEKKPKKQKQIDLSDPTVMASVLDEL